jgi:hypothetical protein
MFQTPRGEWISDFPPQGIFTEQGRRQPFVLRGNTAVIAVVSKKGDPHGGHSAIYAEWPQGAGACWRKFDLIVRDDVIEVRTGRIHENEPTRLPADRELYYRSWAVQLSTVNRLKFAVDRFGAKVSDGRYKYSEPGGLVGRLGGIGHGRRGLNCADFCVKVLTEAGVGHLVSGLFTTPVSLTGRGRESGVLFRHFFDFYPG